MRRLWGTLIMLAVMQAGYSQSATRFSLNGPISLDSLKELVHEGSNTRFSFNSGKVDGLSLIVFQKGSYTLSAVLDQISRSTGLRYRYYKSYVVFTGKPVQQQRKANSAASAGKKQESSFNTENPKTAVHITPHNSLLPAHHTTNPTTISVNDIHLRTWKPSKNRILSPPKQSAMANIPRPKKNDSSVRLDLHGGIGLHVTMPFQGSTDYLTNTNGKSQAFSALIPSVWIRDNIIEKMQVTVYFRYGEEIFGNKTSLKDSLVLLTGVPDSGDHHQQLFFVKSRGLMPGILFDRQITDHFYVGVGPGLYWQTTALLRWISDSAGVSFKPPQNVTINKNSFYWTYFQHHAWVASEEFAYEDRKWRIALEAMELFRGSMKFEDLLQLQLSLRFRIF